MGYPILGDPAVETIARSTVDALAGRHGAELVPVEDLAHAFNRMMVNARDAQTLALYRFGVAVFGLTPTDTYPALIWPDACRIALTTLSDTTDAVRHAVASVAAIASDGGTEGSPEFTAFDDWEQRNAEDIKAWQEEVPEKTRLRRFTLAWRKSVDRLAPSDEDRLLSLVRDAVVSMGAGLDDIRWPCVPDYWYR